MGLIGDEEHGALDVSILLAHKDKLYKITAALEVISLNQIARCGAGALYTDWHLSGEKDLSPRERILGALMAAAKRTESVSGPYVLIDTKDLEYEVVDMGGRNY